MPMSLHSHQFSALGDTGSGDDGFGDDGDASLYGSLSTLGPRKMKKKPVLMLDEQELAKAHMAIAMGGAEIMDTPAPRAVQPAMLLGLAPMGQDDADEDPGLYPDLAFAQDDEPAAEQTDTEEYGVDAEDEAEDAAYATLSPFAIADDEDEEEEGTVEGAAVDMAPPPSYNFDHLLGGNRRKPSVGLNGEMDDEDDEDSIPSIADQLRALRERTTRQPQPPEATQPVPAAQQASAPTPDRIAEPRPAPAAPVAPAPEVVARQTDAPVSTSTQNDAAEPMPAKVRPIIERLEIDDWSPITPMRTAVDQDDAQPEAVTPQAVPQPPVTQSSPEPADRAADANPVAAEPLQLAVEQPTPEPPAPVAVVPSDLSTHSDRDDEWDDAEWDEAVWPDEPTPEPAAATLLDPNHIPRPEPVGGRDGAGWSLDHRPPPSAMRARIRETQDMNVAAPGLLARFTRWLRGLFAR
jgi:hypothetical protein